MASSLRELPANYAAHSALDVGRKGWARTLLNFASFVVWLACIGLLVWIVVRVHPDAGEDAPVFGQAEGVVGLAVLAIFMFGVVAVLHQALNGAGYWVCIRERPRFALSGRYLSVSAPGWYLTRLAYAVVLLAPLIIWLPVTSAAIAFVPAPTVYWVSAALALNIAICVSDLVMIAWVLRQPRGALFNDNARDTGTTAYTPTSSTA
jgi:hypothetical protein